MSQNGKVQHARAGAPFAVITEHQGEPELRFYIRAEEAFKVWAEAYSDAAGRMGVPPALLEVQDPLSYTYAAVFTNSYLADRIEAWKEEVG